MNLKGKVAIVTGSRQGMGRAFALGLAKAGADVVVCDRVVEDGKLDELVKEIEGMGQRALSSGADITDEPSVQELVKQTLEKFGRIDILINNAGVAFHYPLQDTPLKQWLLVLNVNLTGAFICSKAVVPTMIKQKSGSIINITSGSATDSDIGTVATGIAYGVSKAGLERLTLGMATELGQYNIAVNAIKPVKVVNTDGMRFWMADADKSNWQTPDQMVNCAVFLAGQTAQGITGTITSDEEFLTWHGLKKQ